MLRAEWMLEKQEGSGTSYRWRLANRLFNLFDPIKRMFENVDRPTYICSTAGTEHKVLKCHKLRRVEVDEVALLNAVVHAHCVRLKFDIVYFDARTRKGEILVAVDATAYA